MSDGHADSDVQRCVPVGVGYVTLINHLSYTLGEITAARRKELERWAPQRIRRELLEDEYDALIIVDEHNEAASFDLEKEAAILLPSGAGQWACAAVPCVHLRASSYTRPSDADGAKSAVSTPRLKFESCRKPIVGAAANRFVEDPDED